MLLTSQITSNERFVAAKAPVFSHVTASLDGMSTIRSFGAQEMVIKEFDGLQNQHSSAWFLFILCSEAFGMYLDLICMVYLTVVTLQFLVFDYGKLVMLKASKLL